MVLELSVVNWILAIMPVLILLVCLLVLKWEPAQAGAVSWVAAMIFAYAKFGADARLLALANSKGMCVSLYVLLIIWSALFLYNLVDKAKAIQVIGNGITAITDDKGMLLLLMAWCFTSVLQGLAGFGVPVAVVAPILVAMGFSPMVAVSCCLIGHSWAISFGSMGSSYNSIQLVTGIPGEVIAPQMALLFSVAILATGMEVVYVCDGRDGIRRNLGPILSAWLVMSLAMWGMTRIGVAQVATLIAAICGCLVIALWSRAKARGGRQTAPAPLAGERTMRFSTAAFPYYLVIFITLLMQVEPFNSALGGIAWGLDFPLMSTAFGYAEKAATAYSKIRLFTHPAPILFFSALVGSVLYIKKTGASPAIIGEAASATVKKCIPTSVGICTMVMMALVMGSSGMTIMIAQGAAATLGSLYPFASPFIGVLGTFITDSNTNSNVMFGLLQYETGQLIGVSGVLLAAAQSVGGSLGVSIAPTTVMMNAANVGIEGAESAILKHNMRYCLLNAAFVGIAVWLFA